MFVEEKKKEKQKAKVHKRANERMQKTEPMRLSNSPQMRRSSIARVLERGWKWTSKRTVRRELVGA